MCVNAPNASDKCDSVVGEVRIECQLPAHCPSGTVCCGDRETNPQPHYVRVSCEPQCTNGNVVLCDVEGEKAPDCPIANMNGNPTQTVCKPSDLLPPGYLVCSFL
jgi:hypothetical protein